LPSPAERSRLPANWRCSRRWRRVADAAASESFADLFRTKKRAEASPGVSPDGH
jgi:hypothetical protein